MKKIQAFMSNKLEDMVNHGDWTKVEIAARYGIPVSRQSEMKDPGKYPKGGLNESLLAKSIMGGLITVAEIKSNVELSDVERIHIDTMSVLEYANKIRAKGFDPAAILQTWLDSHPEKK